MIDRATSLDELFADPSAAGQVSREEAVALLTQLTTLQVALLRVACSPAEAPRREAERLAGDEMLEVGEAARLLGVSPRWLYRRGRGLPFVRQIGPKTVRYSRVGITRWLVTRRT